MDRAARSDDEALRLRAMMTALEHCWRLVAGVLAAAHRQRRRHEPLVALDDSGWAQPWIGLATRAAAQLHKAEPRVAELARATEALTDEAAVMSMASRVASAMAALHHPIPSSEQLSQACEIMQEAVRDTLTALKLLRGWSLVAVRSTRALDIEGRSLRVDYTDFTGPHLTGVPQRISVTGLPVHEFVYFARWSEGLMVVLDPWIRHARNPQSGQDELFLIERWPDVPGQYSYRSLMGEVRIELDVSRRHLGR